MIIKVVELAKVDTTHTSLDERGQISQPARYSLCETFLNTDHIVSFREINPEHYGSEAAKLGLDERQSFTYVMFTESRRGITIVDSPAGLQKKINHVSDNMELLKG